MTTSVGSTISTMHHMHRPDPSQMASKLFSKLDTANKGYLDKSDLETAFANISDSNSSSSSTSASSTSADDIFSQLDSDGDGKVTQSELTSGLSKLAEQLDSQFNDMRMNGYSSTQDSQGMNGMPPPPPPQDGQGAGDSGFTKDELTRQLSQIGSSDSKRSELISKIVNNFDQADTNGDGKVSMEEAMAYDQSSSASSTSTSTSSDSSSTSSDSSSNSSSNSKSTSAADEVAIMRKIMQLMHAYGGSPADNQNTLSSLLSVSA